MPDQTYWAEALVHSREELSQMLRAARETLGVPLASVAEVLRIRETYLHAIEEGRFEDLPGPTYASAFLRSYAAYVGYNGDDVVAAWRQLDPGADDSRRSHNFRILETERRMPRATMLALSALLLAGAYGVWHWVGGEDVSPVPPVAEVPAHLRVETAGRPATVEPARPIERPTASSVSPVAPAAAAPVATPLVASRPPVEDGPQGATPSRQQPAAPARNDGAATAPTAPGTPPQSGGAANGAAAVPAVPPTAPQRAATVNPPPAAPTRPAPAVPTAPPVTASPNAPAATPPGGNGPAIAAAASRIEPAQPRERVIRVTSSTVLELRDPSSGEILATVNMRAGDSYSVPPYIAYRLIPDR